MTIKFAKAMTDSFLSSPTHLLPLEKTNRLVLQCDFNKDHYEDSNFSKLGIHFPEKLKSAVNKRKAEYLAGRYCAHSALDLISAPMSVIECDDNRCPIWPKGVFGSISHSNESAVAVISRETLFSGIGIDLEQKVALKTMNNIKSHILYHNDEQFLQQSSIDEQTVFTLIFSIKESFFKAAYPVVKKYFDFDAVRMTALDFSNKLFELEVMEDLHPNITKGIQYQGQFLLQKDRVLSLLAI